MATILVTGIGGPAGRTIASMLIERGHIVIGADLRPVTLSGVPCVQIPAAIDPAFLPTLERLAAAVRPALVIPTVSEELPVLAARRASWEYGALAVGPYLAVLQTHDKYHTCVHLASRDLPVPHFALPSQLPDVASVTNRLGWPCLSKPRVSRGGRGVRIYQEGEWPPETALDDTTLVQEFAPGTEYGPNVYIGQNSTTVVVLEKTRLRDGLVGNAAAVRRVAAPDVAAVALGACQALGLQGAADVDVRRRTDGTPVVLEVNARVGANLAHAPEVLDALLIEAGLA